ncbi:molybdenum cofactor synthesis domain-containing protein [Raineyella antarctica]|uniref:Molybdenum cofactor synthesis domain-containing protein n=1 Tax=Raineyella antarctica TaxID=1577474 RepID=A0A1G6GLG2_9ACTN|nr:molybdenum cofactor synthesis domain-containing protein [Raineyella antarctica]
MVSDYDRPVSTPNPTAAILVIGDEILSGRTRDENMYHLAGVLTAHGIDLREVRIVPDDQAAIVGAVNVLRRAYDHVFTSGGIGPTHDDITADAIGAAFGVPVVVDPEADRRVRAFSEVRGMSYNSDQQRMARVPQGATLIDNPISAAPGFTLENVHVMAGVPVIFRVMVESILPALAQGRPVVSGEYRIWRPEGDIAHDLRGLAAKYDDLALGSYPSMQDGRGGTTIVVRGTDPQRVETAVAELRTVFPPE